MWMGKCWKCGAELKIVRAGPESVPKPLPTMVERRPSVAEVEAALGENRGLVDIDQAGANSMIRVMPRVYLKRTGKLEPIKDAMNKFNATYRSGTDAAGNRRGWWEIL